jgi:hypothetical protein
MYSPTKSKRIDNDDVSEIHRHNNKRKEDKQGEEENEWKLRYRRCVQAIKDQTLPHIVHFPTFNCVLAALALFGLLLFIFGVSLLACAYGVRTLAVRYDSDCGSTSPCAVRFSPEEDFEEPAVYYRLENFYANHKNFVDSRSYPQLRGKLLSSASVCEPVERNRDVREPLLSIEDSVLGPGEVAHPCGLPAKYVFSDAFAVADAAGAPLRIDSSDIALGFERNSRFSNSGQRGKQWLDLASEHVMVWFRTELFPDFDKQYGRLEGTLRKGQTYVLTVQNNYIHPDFDLKKSFVFKTTNGLGEDKVLAWIIFLASMYVLLIMIPGLIILE